MLGLYFANIFNFCFDDYDDDYDDDGYDDAGWPSFWQRTSGRWGACQTLETLCCIFCCNSSDENPSGDDDGGQVEKCPGRDPHGDGSS